MATAKLYTFISLFREQADAEHPELPLKAIEIPRIQRDYAQGRDLPEVKRIRDRFLAALHQALTENRPIKLDFVYGNIEQGKLIPLDGQQRLTTLFLLHWYVARHEKIDEEKTLFLENFSYETRRSARAFCRQLVGYTPDFSKKTLSADITDQAWLPLDWQNDPTIQAMLHMLDAIHERFKDTAGLWERLEQGAIAFYFLALKDMGLTDELYIKMNSRGKPLTEFEHFKAEWERTIALLDKDAADRISRKIDGCWTDTLWPYKDENNIIDNAFVRYFTYVCALIYYKYYPEQEMPGDIFDLVNELFAKSADAHRNLDFVEQAFDCWTGENIPVLFDKYLTKEEHAVGKSSVDHAVDVFKDCCNNNDGKRSGGEGKFPLGRMILLYAFILLKQNEGSIAGDFPRRLRIVNNLIKNSPDELREDRMQALLSQTEEIVLQGVVSKKDRSFNAHQVEEEIDKQQWLAANGQQAGRLYRLEDHPLLYGSISILGLQNLHYDDRFRALFACDRGLVNRALLTVGDYSSKMSGWGRYQIGSRNKNSTWKALFHQTNIDQNFSHRRDILVQLLSKKPTFDDTVLKDLVHDWLKTVTAFDWRYYLVKYAPMRLETFGMYYWYDDNKRSYRILAMNTEKSLAGRNYNIFLRTIKMQSKLKHLYLGDYAYSGDGDALELQDKQLSVRSKDASFDIYRHGAKRSFCKVAIPQQGGVDTVDRLDLLGRLLQALDALTTDQMDDGQIKDCLSAQFEMLAPVEARTDEEPAGLPS